MGHLKVKKATYLEKWFNPVSNVDVSFSESTFFQSKLFFLLVDFWSEEIKEVFCVILIFVEFPAKAFE